MILQDCCGRHLSGMCVSIFQNVSTDRNKLLSGYDGL